MRIQITTDSIPIITVRTKTLRMVPSQPFRQADTFKIAVKRPFRHGFIGQGGQHFLRQRLPGRQINHPDITSIYRIAKEQDVKIRMLHVLVHTAFTQIIPRIGFDVNTDCFLLPPIWEESAGHF